MNLLLGIRSRALLAALLFGALVVLLLSAGAKAQGIINTVAGGGSISGTPLAADLPIPFGDAVDAQGNLYFAIPALSSVFKLNSSGQLILVAGDGICSFAGDGGPATTASLCFPEAVALDSVGNLYIADSNNSVVRRVDAATGMITTVAGNRSFGFSGDSGLATSASLNVPEGVAVDQFGNLFIVDAGNCVIRRVGATTAFISTIAGTVPSPSGNSTVPHCGFSGDGGPAVGAQLDFRGPAPASVAVDNSGNVFIADSNNNRVRKVDNTGTIHTFAGGGANFPGDGGPPTSATLNFPDGLALDGSGNLYISEGGSQRIRKVDTTGTITSVAGNGTYGFFGDGGLATNANLALPRGVAVDGSGNLYIVDSNNERIREVAATTHFINTVAGGGSVGDNGQATSAILALPGGLALNSSGDLFIADASDGRVRRVAAGTGLITTVAGNGLIGFAGDNGPATSAELDFFTGVAVDTSGNLFIADSGGSRIRKVDTAGTISTIAGNGSPGFSGDGGPATSASLSNPRALALDGSGNLFIADTDNSRIRRVDAATGIITTVAGNGTAGFSGDGGRATTATLNSPFGITINGSSNLFVADTGNNRIRRVDGSTGIITTVAGNGSRGFGGDGGPATSAMLNFPLGVAVDRANNLLIADTANNRVRGVRGSTGIITTVAGNGSLGFSGDGGPAVNATLNGLQAAVVDLSGNLFIADTFSNRVRRVQLLPTVSLSSTSLSFGGQTVGTPSLQQTVTLSNVGFAPLTITSILAFGDFFQFNNCFPGVASQANCVINVIFLPTAVGTRTGTITITDNAPGSPHVISLSGTGTLPAPIQALSVSAHTLSFSTPLGTVSPPQRIILSNIGSADVIVSGPILTNSAFVISAESCSFIVLGPGAICAVDVQFVGRPAHVSGSLVFSDDAVVSPSVHLIGSAF